MARKSRAPFVALAQLLAERHPDLGDATRPIVDGHVLVDGRHLTNPRALVRRDATIRIVAPAPLRGATKLAHGLDAFRFDPAGRVAVDVGAAAGGFTETLLARGVRRVYAVDVGHGQLRGHLRQDPRVVDLERTNVADVDHHQVDDTIGLVTMDLSYLAIANALAPLERLHYAADAALVALVKPTFELGAARLVTATVEVHAALRAATAAIDRYGWRAHAVTIPMVTGAGGAVEAFVLAYRAAP